MTDPQVQTSNIPIVATQEYLAIIAANKAHFAQLENIIIQSGAELEGNCFYRHQTLNRNSRLLPKQINLFSLGRVGRRILEIGFNAGHSALLFLLANPNNTVTCFDVCTHAYTYPCFDYLAQHFRGRLFIYEGRSRFTVAEYHENHPAGKFDVLHIDGGHWAEAAHRDFVNCRKLAREDSIVIWDDVEMEAPGKLWEQYVQRGYVFPFQLLPTPVSAHALGTFTNLDAPLPPQAGQLIELEP